MSKPRIYEVAKDLNINSKNLLELLKKYDIDSKNHMSTLEDNEINIIFEYFTQMNAKNNTGTATEDSKKGDKDEKSDNGVKNDKNEKTEKPQEKENGKEEVIVKKQSRYVDTRPTNIDLDRLDVEKLAELAPVNNIEQAKVKVKKNISRKSRDSRFAQKTVQAVQKINTEVIIPDEISVGDLAEKLNLPATEIIKKLIQLGIMSSVSQIIDFDTAAIVAEDFGATVTKLVVQTEEDILFNDYEDKDEDLLPRSPVVVVMGHVDHGKTSLLDAIRNTNVIATEAGGITQHIGAHRVKINDSMITFLDTPGHEAFTQMRARGAQVTDIAILVVAADDGIMPQTVEAINHAKAAGVTIIVAINKIDKPGADPDTVKKSLTEYSLVPEEWGGDTICVPVSAKKQINIDLLLEMVILAAQMKELKANPNRPAKGTVIESRLDKGRGPVATVLVQNGTLKSGDVIVAGSAIGRIRAMIDDKGERVSTAGPSTPVEILGLSETPDGGDLFYVVQDERKGRDYVERRKQKIKNDIINARQKISLEALFAQIQEGFVKDLNIIVKADVQGSVEAVKQSMEKLSNDEVRVKIIHGGVGAITESDVMLAAASNAIIVGFNIRPNVSAAASAISQDVEIRTYRIIYEAIEEMEAAMKGLLAPKYQEKVTGHAEIRATFKVSGIGVIAGCHVLDGKINRNSKIRLLRNDVIVHEGILNSLKRFKDDVKEVNSGYECGIGIERFNDIKEGDIIECYTIEEIKQ